MPRPRSISTPVFQLNRRPRSKKSNWFLRLLIPTRITRMTYSCRCPLLVGMTQFIWELFTWDRQRVRLPRWYSILVLSTLLSPVLSAMTRPRAILNSRNMILSPARSYRGTNWTRGARPRPTTCTSQTPTRFSPRLRQSLLTDLPNCKVSSGKITLACSHWGPLSHRA